MKRIYQTGKERLAVSLEIGFCTEREAMINVGEECTQGLSECKRPKEKYCGMLDWRESADAAVSSDTGSASGD